MSDTGQFKTYFFKFSRLSYTVKLIIGATLAAAFIACALTVAIGCGWSGGVARSVRFNDVFTEREFDLLPPLDEHLPANYPNDVYGDIDNLTAQGSYRLAQHQARVRAEELRQVAADAVRAEAEGDLPELQRLLTTMQTLMADVGFEVISNLCDTKQSHLIYDAPVGERCLLAHHIYTRNQLTDRLDLLKSLARGASPEAIKSYWRARTAYDQAAQSDPVEADDVERLTLGVDGAEALAQAMRDLTVKPHALYLQAAIYYRRRDYERAADIFNRIVTDYPRSLKHDAALLMSGLSNMRRSRSYVEGNATALSSAACRECRDEAWNTAFATFAKLARLTSSRYAAEARGWSGYLNLRIGRKGEAMAEYYRLLSDEAAPQDIRIKALTSLRITRPHASADDMRQLENELADEPRAALVYAYHNLYNYTFSSYLNYSLATEEEGRWHPQSNLHQAPDEAELRKEAERAELKRLAAFAEQLIVRHPATAGDFTVRLAQAKLELDEPAAAHRLSRLALQKNLSSDVRPEAWWIKAVAERRLQHHRAARRTLETFINAYPQHRLTEGARRQLAMACEDDGDKFAALDQYFALKYDEDIAYFIDVLLTPDELQTYIARQPHHSSQNKLRYALAVRFLRARRYAEARLTYSQIKTNNKPYDTPDADSYSHDDKPREHLSKNAGARWDTDGEDIESEWIARDLQSLNALESYEHHFVRATTDDARAEALYQMASYLYEGSELIFYNPSAWQHGRFRNLSFIYRANSFRAVGEVSQFWQHLREHSESARALELYMKIAREYPHTRAAPDALYTAAVIHERLDTNESWSELYAAGFYKNGSDITYQMVRHAYPRYQLPRGTIGWQPSTRTVNGGYGWALPPKPLPKLTRRQRVINEITNLKLYAAGLVGKIGSRLDDVWRKRLKPFLIFALFFVGTILTAHLAAIARRRVRRKLNRHSFYRHAKLTSVKTVAVTTGARTRSCGMSALFSAKTKCQ